MKEERQKKEKEIIEGLVGKDGKKFEILIFKEYTNLIWKGKQKYNLTEDEAKDAYTDAILAVIRQVRKRSFLIVSKLYT